MTVVVGFLVFLYLPDSPVKAMRFSDAERVAAILRVKENQSGTQNAKIKRSQVIESFKDLRVWLIALSVMLTSIPNGGLSNFSSILLTTFGYSSRQAVSSMPAFTALTKTDMDDSSFSVSQEELSVRSPSCSAAG